MAGCRMNEGSVTSKLAVLFFCECDERSERSAILSAHDDIPSMSKHI